MEHNPDLPWYRQLHWQVLVAMGLGALTGTIFGVPAADLLFAHLSREEDAGVRGVVARTLGRLRYGEAERALAAEQMLVQLTRDGEGDAPLATLTGAIMGLESMSRSLGPSGLSTATVRRLRELAILGRSGGSEGSARVRRTAMLALSWFGKPGAETLAAALEDGDPDVRRLAVTTMGREPSSDVSIDLLVRGLDDPSPRVRVEAVAALDLLGQVCAGRAMQIELLAGIAAGAEAAEPSEWHRPAHALVSLATVSPGRAGPLLGGFVGHSNPFARVYAARAAAVLGDSDVLEGLASDPVPNVRTAAVQGLARLRGRDADAILIAQIRRFEMSDRRLLSVPAT